MSLQRKHNWHMVPLCTLDTIQHNNACLTRFVCLSVSGNVNELWMYCVVVVVSCVALRRCIVLCCVVLCCVVLCCVVLCCVGVFLCCDCVFVFVFCCDVELCLLIEEFPVTKLLTFHNSPPSVKLLYHLFNLHILIQPNYTTS